MKSETPSPNAPDARKRVISLGRASITGLACLPLLLIALGFARFKLGHDALARVTLAGERVGGEPASVIESKLRQRAQSFGQQRAQVELGSKQLALSAEELGITLAPHESAERALASGRSGSVATNVLAYLRSFWHEQRIEAVTRVDGARFDAALDRVEAALVADPPFAGTIEIVDLKPRALPPRSGRKIARADARGALLRAFALAAPGETPHVPLGAEPVTPTLAPGALERALTQASRVVSSAVTLQAEGRSLRVEAAELGPLVASSVRGAELELGLDPAKVEALLTARRAGLELPARDASFQVSAKDEVSVVPGAPGRSLQPGALVSALWRAALSEERSAELPLLHAPLPARTTEQAEQLGIKQLVGSFTTRHPCCQARVENIHRIATLLDGVIVDPGQTLSVNALVGPRTQKNGFVLAPGIEDGEMVDTMGGGVSQFATTFFNALFHAGYDIIERQPHTYWFPRYPMGHEATLSWPKPDIVFKNDTTAGLLIKTSFSKTTITVKLYGDTGGRKVSSSVSERREIVKPPVELLANREILPDEEKVKEGGMIGWSVIASRVVTFADGTKKEERRKVTYRPKARRVEVHPCRIPDGEPGATGEPCPEPPDVQEGETEAPAHAE